MGLIRKGLHVILVKVMQTSIKFELSMASYFIILRLTFAGIDSWNSYANEVGSWSRVNNPPPPPPPSSSRRHGHHGSSSHCLLMRGLPYKANENDIRKVWNQINAHTLALSQNPR